MTRDARGRFVKRTSVPVVSNVSHGTSLPPTFRSSWPYFALLIAAAVAWHYAAPFIILVSIIVGPFLLLGRLAPRYPRAAGIVAAAISGVISGLFGSSGYYRRRRWW